MDSVHISTARRMLDSGEHCALKVWKSDASILDYPDCVSLNYDFYGGFRNVKIYPSGQIRRVRDVCIFEINGLEVYL